MHTTPADLARHLDVSQKRIRDYLRERYGTLSIGTTRWELTDEQADEVRLHFSSSVIGRPWESSPTQELLSTYAEILAELRQREVIRTSNAPLGDYAEYLAAIAYSGVLARSSAKSYDITAEDGRRIQVKARTRGDGSRSAVFSVFRSFDFDVATLMTFSSRTYELLSARELTPAQVRDNSRWSSHVNGHLLSVVKASGLGTDVTEMFDRRTDM